MKTILRYLFILLAGMTAFTTQQTKAAHLIGGELTYECLGGDVFQINMVIYRDCYCVSCALFDNPAYITIFNASGGVVQNVSMFSPVIEQLTVSTEGLCLETGPDVCVERGFYQTTVTLPFISGGYQIVHQRCCRNNTIVNIVDPGGTGSTYVANVPDTVLGECNNSSPVFNFYPPIVVCANSPLVVNSSATDADGDQLVYSICEPFLGASALAPQPVSASIPPYANVTWLPPYSGTNQLGGFPTMAIDPNTGIFSAFPTETGQYVVGICVSEYRDGVLISTNLRDFQFNVTECQVVLAQASISSGSSTICPGQSVQLEGSAFGGDMISWSPSTGLSNTEILNPIATPTQTTTYTLTVINPFVGCEDSDQITIFVADDVIADAGDDVEFCPGDAVQLGSSNTVGTFFSWTPTDGLSDPTVSNPVAFPTETVTYILTVTDSTGVCVATDEITLILGSNADPGTMPSDEVVLCAGSSSNISTDGAVLGDNDVLAYVLHTSPSDVLGTVLSVNSEGGIFSANSSPSINTYTTYYVSAVAGPEGSTPGVPDFNNPCTKVAPGTPIVFLAPVAFYINDYCDFFTGDYHILLALTGGYPQYNLDAEYVVIGDFNGTLGFGETVEVILLFGSTTSYAFEVISDGLGCTGSTANEDFYCDKTPVTLLSFYGKAIETGNLLEWSTATETDNDFFTLQRSTGNVNEFYSVATIKGAGNSIVTQNYSYLDQNAPQGLCYYRLIQTDFNGTSTNSEIISINRSYQSPQVFNVQPVPASDLVTISFSATIDGTARLELFDVAGKLVKIEILQIFAASVNQTNFLVDGLPDGVYLLNITTPAERYTTKLVKQ
ncbi:MAG: T9SS type A sorting domain-containing protein [Sphingobacteriales bacterium]|nr:MAG: T9SS type A sorting domain-containing protein [Sphingobacteriales bacterium]